MKNLLTYNGVILGEFKGSRSNSVNDFEFSTLRMREIEAVIKYRHGAVLEQTDDAIFYIEAAASSLRNLDHLKAWCNRWCPWAANDENGVILSAFWKYENRKRDLKADTIATLLNIKFSERIAIGLKTIGACDISRQDREIITKELRRTNDKERKKDRRQKEGALSRKEYLDLCSHGDPWLEQGISRATWFRNKKRNETGPSHIDNIVVADEPVSHLKNIDAQHRRGAGGRVPLLKPRASDCEANEGNQ